MIPRLYNYHTNDMEYYGTNGLGFFKTCTSCIVSETLNGDYILQLTAIAGDPMLKYVVPGMVIKAKANAVDPLQLFYITDVSFDKVGNVTIMATHIRMLFYQNTTIGYADAPINSSCNYIMNEWIIPHLALPNYFTFYSSITEFKEMSLGITSVATLGDICSDKEGGLLNLFGGDYYFNNFEITLNKYRAKSVTSRIIRVGQNLEELQHSYSNTNTYRYLLPYANIKTQTTDVTIQLSTDSLVPVGDSSNTSEKILPVDFTTDMKDYKVNTATGVGYDEAQAKLTALANEYITNNDLINNKMSVSMIYRPELDKGSQRLYLGDRPTIICKDGSKIKAKIRKVTYDSLREIYTAIEIGEKPLNLTDYIKSNRRF